MPRTCPDCQIALETKDFHNVKLDACPRCAGIFFDEGELNALRLDGNSVLTEVEDAIAPSVDVVEFTEPTRHCPTCHTGMDKYRYLYNSPVMLDSCSKCGGVWVQNGELEQMRQILDQNAMRDTAVPTKAQVQLRSEAQISRAKRVERVFRFLGRRLS